MSKKNYKYVIVAVFFLALFVGNYFQYQLSPLAARLMSDLNISPVQYSSIFSAPMLSAIFFGIIAGILTDKFGVKKVTTIGLIIMAVGLWIRPFAASYLPMYIAMILAGFGITFLNVNMAKILGGWFSPAKIGPMMGITMIGCTLGMTLGIGTTALLPSTEFAFILAAVMEVVILLMWILFMKEGRENSAQEIPESVSVRESLTACIRSKSVWLVGGCLMCIMACNVALTSFLPATLMSRGFTETAAGSLTMPLTIGNLAGSLLGTILITKIGRMKPCLILLAILCGICSAFAWQLGTAGIIAALGLTGFAFGTLVPTFMTFPSLLPEIGPKYAGSAGGFIATLELIGAVVIPTYIITPVSSGNYTTYFFLAGGVMILMAVIALFLPELLKKSGN